MTKVDRLSEQLKKKKIDAVLLLTSSRNKVDSNITYFTGLDNIDLCFFVMNKERTFVFVHKLEYEKAKKYSLIKNVRIIKKGFFEMIKQELKRCKRVGINKNILSINEYNKLKGQLKVHFIDISGIVQELREVKKSEEINLIEKSCLIASEILDDCIKNFRKFNRETDVSSFLKNKASLMGFSTSFEPIVASGNSDLIHYSSENIRLKKGFCIIDFGIKYGNYCSDMTRTIFIGKPSKKDVELYETVLCAQKECIYMVREGAFAKDIDFHARKKLGMYSKYFIHGLGHQLGIDIHEGRSINRKGNFRLKENMIITIEPGIYLKNRFGIRIEDTLRVTKNDCIELTKSKKDLICIPHY